MPYLILHYMKSSNQFDFTFYSSTEDIAFYICLSLCTPT
jgi:hypothetical protein